MISQLDRVKIKKIRQDRYVVDNFTGPVFQPNLSFQQPQSADFKLYIAKLEVFRTNHPFVGPLSLDQIHSNTGISKEKLKTKISDLKRDGYLKHQESENKRSYLLEPTDKLIIEVLNKHAWTRRDIENNKESNNI